MKNLNLSDLKKTRNSRSGQRVWIAVFLSMAAFFGASCLHVLKERIVDFYAVVFPVSADGAQAVEVDLAGRLYKPTEVGNFTYRAVSVQRHMERTFRAGFKIRFAVWPTQLRDLFSTADHTVAYHQIVEPLLQSYIFREYLESLRLYARKAVNENMNEAFEALPFRPNMGPVSDEYVIRDVDLIKWVGEEVLVADPYFLYGNRAPRAQSGSKASLQELAIQRSGLQNILKASDQLLLQSVLGADTCVRLQSTPGALHSDPWISKLVHYCPDFTSSKVALDSEHPFDEFGNFFNQNTLVFGRLIILALLFGAFGTLIIYYGLILVRIASASLEA